MKEYKGRIKIVIVAAFVILITLLSAKKTEAADIMISNADLATARTTGACEEKGITYTAFTDQEKDNGFDGDGIFSFSIAETYKLQEDITLDGECFVFTAENADVILDMNGKTIDYVNEVCTEYPDGHGGTKYDPYSAIRAKNNKFFVTGNGTINTNQTYGQYYCGAIEIESEGVIYNGTYNGTILCGHQEDGTDAKLLTIYGGTYNRIVASAAPIYFDNGTFNELEIEKGGIINGGTYEEIEADSKYYYEDVYGNIENVTEVFDLVINGGTFKYTGDSGVAEPLNVRGVNLYINNGTFTNIGESQIYSDCVRYDGLNIAKLRINGGSFDSPVGFCVTSSDALSSTVNGGTFRGYYGGIGFFGESSLNVQLAGGTYETTGSDKRGFSRNIYGGIIFAESKDENDIGEDNVKFVNKALAPGYKYSPNVLVNENITAVEKVLYTQRAIKVIPIDEEDVSIVSNCEDLKKQATDLIKKIQAGESVEGINEDLAKKILYAIGANKELKIELVVNKVDREAVAKDAEVIENAVETKQSISGFFDVYIVVKIDGEIVGNITKLDDAITVDIPVDESEQNIAEGFTRKFKVYKVHNGNLDVMEPKMNDSCVSVSSSEFSTFALVYEDIEGGEALKSPKAGDNGIFAWVSVVVVSFLMGGAIIKIKKIK